MNHWSKKIIYQVLFVVFAFIGFPMMLFSQVTIELTVLDGAAITPDCGGLFDAGEPAISLIVENGPEITYSPESCPNIPEFPNMQFDTTLSCLSDLRGGELQVCFRTYFREFTGFLGSNVCEVPNSAFRCGNNICPNILLPSPGQDSTYTIEIPQSLGLSSYGFITFRIAVSEDASSNPTASNDRICHAINMGELSQGGTLGNKDLGLFNNYCATSITEPSPNQDGISWQNNVATWFSFTTSDDPNAVILVEGISDPENINDPVNLQLALYESSDNSCEGNLTFISGNFDGNTFDEYLILSCLEPNKQYFLMVDGEITTPDLLHGIFGLQISEVAIENQSNDVICDAIELDVVSSGASGTIKQYANFCATNINDPATAFPTTNSVWFKFRPTQSRRAFIVVESGLPYPLGIDAIDPEIAVFYAPSNQCNGQLVEIASQNSMGNVNSEFLELECLNPKNTYYIMIDGSDLDPTGVFSVNVVERGYPAPISVDTLICRGGVLNLGDKSYANAGTYLDTIVMDDECLSIIETNLSVVEPLDLNLRVQELARAEGESGGVVIAQVQFGTGDYSYEWSNGQTNLVANNLIGGEEYCLTVRDNNASCTVDTCFIMEFPIPITANIISDTLDCSYHVSGQIQVEITAGKPPYQFQLKGIDDPSFVENGVIIKNDTSLIINEIPAGRYNIFVSNGESTPNFEVEVVAPPPISIGLTNQENATCFESCNGSLELDVTGGTGAFDFAWDNGLISVSNPTDICAGEYFVTVTDEKNCVDSTKFTIIEPDAPIVTFSNVEPVICFGEDNGQATVTINEPVTSILWDNGETTETVTNLDAGMHQVVIINENGCESSASLEIIQPDAPLVAAIDIMETIDCGGDTNGVLADASTGGNANYQYSWNNGSTADFIDNLPAGKYTLTVRDEKGCEDEAIANLDEPTPIDATFVTQDVTCPAGENSGIIFIVNPTGGTTPYRYSANNQGFINNTEITNLQAGTYAVLMQDDKGCEKVFEEITINHPPEVTVNLGEDMDIQLGNTLDLKATVNRQVVFEWFSPDSLSCLDCPTVTSRPFNNTTYSVRVTDIETGCVAEDAIAVSVLKARNLYVPNVFSPNGDGINDEVNLFGGDDIDRVLRFEIYARNGSKVFQKENFELTNGIGWDGTFDSQQLSTDVFIYFAEIQFIDGATEIFKGDFTLVR